MRFGESMQWKSRNHPEFMIMIMIKGEIYLIELALGDNLVQALNRMWALVKNFVELFRGLV
jgi:hypothetical protein